MIRQFLILISLTWMLTPGNAQVYYTKNGSISFFSKTSLQDIKADNNQVISVLDSQSGTIQFSLLNDAFHFPKAKMEEDFNENYIESAKYPKSTFKGMIADINQVNFTADGKYPVHVNGELSIHGVSKKITTPATITIKNGNLSALASFHVLVKDYQIHIPSIMMNKVAEDIEVTVNCNYQKK